MNLFSIFIIGLAIAIFIIVKFFDFARREEPTVPKDEKYPYHRKDYLLTAAEKNFFEVLKPICDERNWLLFAKVRLEDLIWIPKGTTHLLRWRGYVRSRHIDFVICDRQNIRPLCAIELDDSTHKQYAQMEQDNMKNLILAAAGLPILRFPVSYAYNSMALIKAIQEAISARFNNLSVR